MKNYPMLRTIPRYISRESLVLIALCTLDAVITVFLVTNGMAVEANPIMRRCMEYGIGAFYLAKMLPLVLFVGLSEWYRRRNPLFVKTALRLCVVAYVAFYLVSVGMVNLI